MKELKARWPWNTKPIYPHLFKREEEQECKPFREEKGRAIKWFTTNGDRRVGTYQ